ncbi:MAG: HAD family hydrolase [Acidithiobacillus sp.]|nr:HAD family hydrolase [Acidithiobacillus sp.]
MPPLRALIFDVDGTLADTERDAHRVAFNDAFAELGLPFHWDVETYGQYLQVTGGKERLRAYLQDHPQYPQISDAEIRRIHARKTERYGEIIASGGIALRPGIARLLAEAQEQDLLLAIATTTTPANVEALLHSTLGAQGWSRFQYIGAGDVVPHKKPAPDIYLHVLEKLGLSPQECLALEDSENGLHAARDAGLEVIITQTAYTAHQDFSGALCVLDHLGEAHSPATILSGPHKGEQAVIDLSWLRKWREENVDCRLRLGGGCPSGHDS